MTVARNWFRGFFVQILERPLSWSVEQGRLSVWGFQINLGASQPSGSSFYPAAHDEECGFRYQEEAEV